MGVDKMDNDNSNTRPTLHIHQCPIALQTSCVSWIHAFCVRVQSRCLKRIVCEDVSFQSWNMGKRKATEGDGQSSTGRPEVGSFT